jgi:disulfide bond formation protein DsbB
MTALIGENAFAKARLLALLTPLALLGGAYISEYGFDLYPCEMCWWQRYPHFVALGLGLLALLRPGSRGLVVLGGLAILSSGLIGAYHAGVEYHWWEGLTACTSTADPGAADPLAAILNAPLIRCDVAQWELMGVSLAGFNFLISTAAALVIFALLGRSRRRAA